ncbi:MAG: FixH family protein [Rhizobiaceae bacterium]|nr:FixH family protein [Rhizobiaceae bacterium]
MRKPMQGTFTGRHMLLVMLAFFGVIIAVNVTMAVFAGSSWTGFVVRNSYVASQEFNGKVAAARMQDALGWTAELSIANGHALLTLADRDGRSVAMERAQIVLRNPASDADDRTVELAADGNSMSARVDLRDGLWVVEIDAFVAGHQPWRDTRRIHVAGGAIR